MLFPFGMESLQPSDQICDGRYEILKKVGSGGEGAVYLAMDCVLNRKVAIKKIHAEKKSIGTDASGIPDLEQAQAIMATIEEASRLASLQHPNIVTVYDFIRQPSGILVIMEFLKGKNIDELPNPMSLGMFWKFAEQCLQGLSAAHSIGMIHRDIKPGNIILQETSSDDFQVKILDFGLAKVIQEPSEQTRDHSGALMGSIFMMSPEQLRAEPIDFRSDIYSLGCVFYKAFTKEHPFKGASVPAVITAHLEHGLTPLTSLRPDLPPTLISWIERLFALDRNDRPASAKVALEELKSIQAALSAPARRPRKPLPPNIIIHRQPDSPYVTLELQSASTAA